MLVATVMVLMALHIIMVSGDANMYGSGIDTYIMRVSLLGSSDIDADTASERV